jgi:hypothetical protein
MNRIPIMASLSKIPFVVSLSNHAVGIMPELHNSSFHRPQHVPANPPFMPS